MSCGAMNDYSDKSTAWAESELMMQARQSISTTLADALEPGRAALVVYDMQAGILRQMADSAAILAKVGEVLAAARTAKMPTFFMRHLSLPKNLMGSFQTRQAMAWQRADSPEAVTPWFLRGTPAHEIAAELSPREDEAVFDKIGMSAFVGTPLNVALRDLGVRTVVLAGVATEIGIEPTVRHAADLGFVPVLIEDACGAGDAEAGERATASMRFMGDAMFTGVAEFRRLVGE